MYVTYERDQVPLLRKSRPSDLKQGGGDFQPTWLVRAKDMTPVRGTEAKKVGYCTLSYSWNYSGDIITDNQGQSSFSDCGQHKIISKQDGDMHQQVRLGKFEDVIQQICKDFDIQYIWYDKMCIDQNDKVAKQNEIKQMYKIYSEANYTVALIPELYVPDSVNRMDWKRFIMSAASGYARNWKQTTESEAYVQCMKDILSSEWSKRLWTLEEAFMSKSMVFVGRNAHLWLSYFRILTWESLFYNPSISKKQMISTTEESPFGLGTEILFSFRTRSASANITLYHAHQRTTTVPHDRVFALSHLVADRFHVDVDYSLPAESVIRLFYQNLAETDLRILCFGKPARLYKSTIRGLYDFPSWTGIEGIHVPSKDMTYRSTPFNEGFSCAVDDKMRMHIENCTYTRVTLMPEPEDYSAYRKFADRHLFYGVLKHTHYTQAVIKRKTNKLLLACTGRLDIKKPVVHGDMPFILPLSLTDDRDECMILDLPFYDRSDAIYFPVIGQVQGGAFKSIGVIQLPLLFGGKKMEWIRLADIFTEIKKDSFIIT